MRRTKEENRRIDRAIGRRLAEIRRAREMTQIDLAAALGVTQAHLSKYERGDVRMTAVGILKAAKALKVSSDELLGLRKSRLA